MQDGASVHRSEYTKEFLYGNYEYVLPWSSKSLNLNIIENFWGMMVRYIYKEGRKFENTEDLGASMSDAWNSIGLQHVRNLYRSIPRRLISVIDRNGRETEY